MFYLPQGHPRGHSRVFCCLASGCSWRSVGTTCARPAPSVLIVSEGDVRAPYVKEQVT